MDMLRDSRNMGKYPSINAFLPLMLEPLKFPKECNRCGHSFEALAKHKLYPNFAGVYRVALHIVGLGLTSDTPDWEAHDCCRLAILTSTTYDNLPMVGTPADPSKVEYPFDDVRDLDSMRLVIDFNALRSKSTIWTNEKRLSLLDDSRTITNKKGEKITESVYEHAYDSLDKIYKEDVERYKELRLMYNPYGHAAAALQAYYDKKRRHDYVSPSMVRMLSILVEYPGIVPAHVYTAQTFDVLCPRDNDGSTIAALLQYERLQNDLPPIRWLAVKSSTLPDRSHLFDRFSAQWLVVLDHLTDPIRRATTIVVDSMEYVRRPFVPSMGSYVSVPSAGAGSADAGGASNDGYDLVICVGDSKSWKNMKEQQRIQYEEWRITLNVLRIGGTAIIRMTPTTDMSHVSDMADFLSRFHDTKVVVPACSDRLAPEFYIVCTEYVGLDAPPPREQNDLIDPIIRTLFNRFYHDWDDTVDSFYKVARGREPPPPITFVHTIEAANDYIEYLMGSSY